MISFETIFMIGWNFFTYLTNYLSENLCENKDTTWRSISVVWIQSISNNLYGAWKVRYQLPNKHMSLKTFHLNRHTRTSLFNSLLRLSNFNESKIYISAEIRQYSFMCQSDWQSAVIRKMMSDQLDQMNFRDSLGWLQLTNHLATHHKHGLGF